MKKNKESGYDGPYKEGLGGIVTGPTSALIGESGPEVIYDPEKKEVKMKPKEKKETPPNQFPNADI